MKIVFKELKDIFEGIFCIMLGMMSLYHAVLWGFFDGDDKSYLIWLVTLVYFEVSSTKTTPGGNDEQG